MERAIPEWASEYVGIPYKTHGRDRSVRIGANCARGTAEDDGIEPGSGRELR